MEVFFDDFSVTQIKSPIIATEDFYPFGLAFNEYTKEQSLHQDYKYNGKELQDELNLDWLDYGARMYMPEIGRWGVIDPHVENYEGISPYAYAFNNPLLFVDPTGMDNIIYLLVAGDFDRNKAKDIAAEATKILNDLGMKIEVQYYDQEERGEFDPTKLSDTDNWAVIGDDRKAVAGMARGLDRKGDRDRDEKGKSDYEYEIDAWEKSPGGNPEVSNLKGKKGIVVDYNDTVSPKEKKTGSALAVDHGAGHSSEEGAHHENDGIMADGYKLRSEYMKHGYKYLFQPQYNEEYVRRMNQRYSSKEAKDNYPKKKK